MKSLFPFAMMAACMMAACSHDDATPLPVDLGHSPKMLTDDNNPLIDFMFTADPTSVVKDGRLYVYGTNDHEQYLNAEKNGYEKIKSLVMISTDDMANWTYHGTIPIGEIAPWIVNSWAPSIACRQMPDGSEAYYIYFSNSGCGVGVLSAPTPVGPWSDPLGHPLISVDTPTLGDCPNPFDPGVVIDGNGTAWLAFGGGVSKSGSEAMPGTSRIVRLADDMVSLDSDISAIPAPYFFEASELNYVNGEWLYTYCDNWVPRDQWDYPVDKPSQASMAYMSSATPLDPASWVYRGDYLPNAGETVPPYTNNHSHLHQFGDKCYVLCHSMYLQDSYGSEGGFRNMTAEEICIDSINHTIARTVHSRAGVAQVMHPAASEWREAESVHATANANFVPTETLGNMAIASLPDTTMVYKVRGLDFSGERKYVASVKGTGQIDIYIDSITSKPAAMLVADGIADWKEVSARLSQSPKGVHDVYFVVGGPDFILDSYRFAH